jgi:hypothetical protein
MGRSSGGETALCGVELQGGLAYGLKPVLFPAVCTGLAIQSKGSQVFRSPGMYRVGKLVKSLGEWVLQIETFIK